MEIKQNYHNRQTDTLADGHRQTDRQTDRHTHTHTDGHRQTQTHILPENPSIRGKQNKVD